MPHAHVGIDRYAAMRIPSLKYAVNDTDEISIRNDSAEFDVVMLTNKTATRQEVYWALEAPGLPPTSMPSVCFRRARQAHDQIPSRWNILTPTHGGAQLSVSWLLLDDVAPRLSSWPVVELVRLVDSVEGDELENPVMTVERAVGRSLTVEEQGLVMLKVLAPANLGTPPEPWRIAFTRVATLSEPWAAAVWTGALGAND